MAITPKLDSARLQKANQSLFFLPLKRCRKERRSKEKTELTDGYRVAFGVFFFVDKVKSHAFQPSSR